MIMIGLGTTTLSMLLSILLLAVIPFVVVSQHIQVPEYGACFNRKLRESGSNLREALHCHFDSSECKKNEEYITAFAIAERKWPKCTCDTRTYTNVYVNTCYDVKAEQMVCGSSGNCPADGESYGEAYNFGNRLNKEDHVVSTCKPGTKSYGPPFDPTRQTSCGKRCQCNMAFKSGQQKVVAGDTKYGVCRNTETDEEYCAIKQMFCAAGETFVEYWDSEKKCTCLNTPTGACLDDATTFSHCAISEDDCKDGQQFMHAKELMSPSSPVNAKCRLCGNTWETTDSPTINTDTDVPTATPSVAETLPPSNVPSNQPSESPTTTVAPSDSPTKSPTFSPTTNPTTSAPTTSSAPTTMPTTYPTAEPSAVPSSLPTSSPTITAKPTVSHQPTNLPSTTPTAEPSTNPTTAPTAEPSTNPSASPTTPSPTLNPSTSAPTPTPSDFPTKKPSKSPTIAPTPTPTDLPTNSPTENHCTDPGSNCYIKNPWNTCDDLVCKAKVCSSKPGCCKQGASWNLSCATKAIQKCRNCPCSEKPFDKFVSRVTYNMFIGQSIKEYRTCNWLSKSAFPSQKEQLCARFKAEDGSPGARTVCPGTCEAPVC